MSFIPDFFSAVFGNCVRRRIERFASDKLGVIDPDRLGFHPRAFPCDEYHRDD